MNAFNLYTRVLTAYSIFSSVCFTVTHNKKLYLTCNGWTNSDLGHSLHANEGGQMRLAISPATRYEVLRHQLALNLDIAAHEHAGESRV